MCREIKSDPALRHIAVILLTSLTDAEDLVRGLEAQADCYLTKPYDAPVLLERVRQFLNSPVGDAAGDALAPVEIAVGGQVHTVTTNRRQLLNLLLSTYENAVQQHRQLVETQRELEAANQQLRAQAAKLEQSQANYRALLENNADAMIVVDRRGDVRFLNPAARSLFGPQDQQFLSDILRHPDTAGTSLEVTIDRAGRDPVVAELHIVETQWELEPAALATLRDITARKAYERQIAELETQLTV
jgi:two-component system cell cycle response regulator